MKKILPRVHKTQNRLIEGVAATAKTSGIGRKDSKFSRQDSEATNLDGG